MGRDTPSDEDFISAVQVKCDKANALLISWADESNDHALYHDQVQQIRSTFEDTYGFPTTCVSLDATRSLELQVLSKVSDFAAAHDGSGDLLIVYYAGFVDVGDYCFKSDLNKFKSRDEIIWEECEKVLRMTLSHVLWIFDGVFEELSIRIDPSYKWKPPPLPSPPISMTPALIESLRIVAEQACEGEVSTTKDLVKMIRAELCANVDADDPGFHTTANPGTPSVSTVAASPIALGVKYLRNATLLDSDLAERIGDISADLEK
ncbi:MAG: hypothetical protein Q9168_007109 [Polycauliona sp. 1 TL-2023]